MLCIVNLENANSKNHVKVTRKFNLSILLNNENYTKDSVLVYWMRLA